MLILVESELTHHLIWLFSFCLWNAQKYEEYYQQEEELNNQLNIFAINYSAIYGGYNDVKTQLHYNIDKGRHTATIRISHHTCIV